LRRTTKCFSKNPDWTILSGADKLNVFYAPAFAGKIEFNEGNSDLSSTTPF